ncbi:MAG: flagellar filament capping protein FliD [Proteobacteria bacterium]|nr:flagellar filament capping protein FliD [Pseudomonadota bacterium]
MAGTISQAAVAPTAYSKTAGKDVADLVAELLAGLKGSAEPQDLFTTQPKLYGKIMGKNVEDILAELKAAAMVKPQKTEEKIQQVNEKAASLSAYQASIEGLNASLKALNGKGIGASPSGAFAARSLNLVSGNISNIDATATNDAPLGDIQLLIKQIAKKDDSAATAGVADPTTALGWSGSFVVGSGSTSTTINMTASMSMNDILDAVNNQTQTVGVSAALTTLPSSKVLSFQATNFAAPIVVDTTNLVVPGGSTYDATILPPTSNRTVQNLSAIVQFRNVNTDIYYPSNEIPAGAQVPGVSFKLLNADPATPLVLNVQNNQAAAREAIDTFIASYNSLQDYLATDTAYKGNVRDTVRMSMEQLFGPASGIGAGQLSSLAVMGIMPDKTGKLIPDEAILTSKLNTSFSQVANVFGYSITSSNTSFIPAGRPTNTMTDVYTSGVQATVSKAVDGTLSATMTLAGQSYAATLGTVDGSTVTIKAPDDSPLKGLSLVFNGLLNMPNGVASSASTNLSFTSGVADKLTAALDNYLNPDPKVGLFSRALQDLVGNPLDKEVKGEKQRLEDTKKQQMEKANATIEKLQRDFARALAAATQAEAIKHSIEVYTKVSAAAAA